MRNKAAAQRTADALEALGVSAFLAHRDIVAAEDWESRIRKELNRCSVFVPLITKAFWESEWAPQEVGAAATRADRCLVIAVMLGKNHPRGFLKRVQGIHATSRSMGPAIFIEPLVTKFPAETLPGVVSHMRSAKSPREAEERLELLLPFFRRLDSSQSKIAAAFLVRSRLSKRCREELVPAFLRSRRSVLPENLRKALAAV